jgi:Fe2+ or Zn2+ uptake regulation protein
MRKRILDLIRQSDGRLGWYEIARSLGADELAERGEVFFELRALEKLGAIHREVADGAVRFSIVARASE